MRCRADDQGERLATLLYERDPFLMGSLIHAPEDEYEPVARRLLPELVKAARHEDVARVLAGYGVTDAELTNDVWSIFGSTAAEYSNRADEQ